MKKATYILCLIATWFAGELIASKIITIFVNSLITNEISIVFASYAIKMLSSAIPILAAYRFIIFIKSRSIIIPNNFNGVSYVIGKL